MSKIQLFAAAVALLGLVSAAASGDESVSAEARFSLTTALSYQETVAVHIRGRKIFVNGLKLSKTESILLEDALRDAFRVEKAQPRKPCPAGTFEHVVRRAGREQKESGCLGDKRYGALRVSFVKLRSGRPLAYVDPH